MQSYRLSRHNIIGTREGMKTHSCLTICLLTVAILVGCQSDLGKNPVDVGSAPDRVHENQPDLQDKSSGCSTVSGVVLPGVGLLLNNLTSQAMYPPGAVLSSLVVSFSICDPSMAVPASKVQIYGSALNVLFLDSVRVELSLMDAGLPSGTPENSQYSVLRLNEDAGEWVIHQTGRVLSQRVRYSFLVNGTYAVSLTGMLALDSLWTVTGFIGASGGTLNLLNSSLAVWPGAVSQTHEFSFTIVEGTPEGVPDALPRVYIFGPEGLTFADTVLLSVPFIDAGDDGSGDRIVHLYYYNETNNTWMVQPNPVRTTSEGYSVQLHHFSRYAFGR